MMRRGRNRIAVVTGGQKINPRSDLNASLRRWIELTIAMRQCHHAAAHRVVRFNPRENTAAARLDNHPTAVDRAQLRDIVRMNSERAVGVFLAPRGIAENLVGVVGAALTCVEEEWIFWIEALLRRVERFDPIEQARNRESHLPI